MAEYAGGSVEAEHLCVLVHGLWGNPNHMANIAKALRAEYPADKLYILLAKSNSGSFTYDGIELGGERVCREIESELSAIEGRGGKIRKLSVVGYSLGGLVARYAVGLLHAKGVLDGLECMNFTAFASPFLGVRTPLRGWTNHIWNVLGARTLSKSGRQLFTIDDFRGTGRPLLAVLADPNSIFMRGLARFRRRTLYANIVNDRSAVYYTTAISKTDPFAQLSRVQLHSLPGYEDVVLDPVRPVSPLPPDARPASLYTSLRALISSLPFYVAVVVFVPIASAVFLVTAMVQTARSAQRIKLHEKGLAGIDVTPYRSLPLLVDGLRGAVEDAYENLNSAQSQEFLGTEPDGEEEDSQEGEGEEASEDSSGEDGARDDSGNRTNGGATGGGVAATTTTTTATAPSSPLSAQQLQRRRRQRKKSDAQILALERRQSQPEQPTLALTADQFAMIDALDALGWRKYPVYIQKVRHSHAAIIVRSDKAGFSEGWVVLRHWLREEFLF
ncbi:hypothetical protein VTK73DRAFT_6421 [Phialemonium thermophilum]|uniref:DUF676 domain-containing protein n=1 Tax=Phialemonium thermophilum TaxID=223376 RepID=A0ABR3WJY2_9PEZI